MANDPYNTGGLGPAAAGRCKNHHFLADAIRDNIGNTVTVYTSSGGVSGYGFTGLLTDTDNCNIKLVTSPPAPPASPFLNTRRYNGCFNPSGSIAIIPIDQIVAFVYRKV